MLAVEKVGVDESTGALCSSHLKLACEEVGCPT